ncbi:MAG: hypothetical protein CFE44_22505 [Burkholderiales bacterium PBB4]|nr:MAG: hypothetical protein CFE44_22505 [Burkholderiales bacterium PBB4]
MIVLKAPQQKLLEALQSVAGIVERRHTLPILANVLMRKTGDDIEFTTSDLEIQVRTTATLGGDGGNLATTVGARKSRFTLQTLPADDFPLVNEAVDFGPAFAVPQKVLKGLVNQVHFAMAVHDIRYYLNGILFVAEGKTLTLVATDGHRLALAQSQLETEVPKQEVILPRKTVLELQQGVRVNIEPGVLRIASSNAEQEEAKEELEIDYGGDTIEVGFNVTYLMDALGNIGTDMVKLELQDGNSSALLTVPEQPGFKYVVMPMRI